MKSNKEFNPDTVKRIIGVIIAILSALAGALAENQTSFINHLI